MLRLALATTALIAVSGFAGAQQAPEPAVDFIMRPGEDPPGYDGTDAFWARQLEPDQPAPIVATPPVPDPAVQVPIGPPLLGPTLPAVPASVRGPARDEVAADPFAPAGWRFGSFIIRPSIDIGVSATDNAEEEAGGDAAVGLLVAPALNVISEDDRHSVQADVHGTAILYGDDELDQRSGDARIAARYDLTARSSVSAEAGYSLYLDRFSDPDTPDAAAQRPAVHQLDAKLGGTQQLGRVGLGLFGTVERELHEDVDLSGGGTASRAELNNTEYGAQLKATYRLGPLTPFATVGAGRRDYDRAEDDDGFRRSGSWGELRGGVAFDLGSKLSGEASLGFRREEPEDSRLDPLNVPLVNASILWSPRRLTEIRVDLSTDVRATSLAGSTGSILYSGTVSAAQRIGARWRAEVGVGSDYERYVGGDLHEVTTSAYAELAYSLNRYAALIGRYSFEHFDSSDPGADYNANVVGVRLRIQR